MKNSLECRIGGGRGGSKSLDYCIKSKVIIISYHVSTKLGKKIWPAGLFLTTNKEKLLFVKLIY